MKKKIASGLFWGILSDTLCLISLKAVRILTPNFADLPAEFFQ
jgi:hypothetical protein